MRRAALDGRSVLVTARERCENTCVNRCTFATETSFNRCRRLRDDSAAGVMARLHRDFRQKGPDCTHVLCWVVGRRILPGRSCFCRHPRCGYELGMDGRRFGMLGFVPRQIVRRIPCPGGHDVARRQRSRSSCVWRSALFKYVAAQQVQRFESGGLWCVLVAEGTCEEEQSKFEQDGSGRRWCGVAWRWLKPFSLEISVLCDTG